MALERQLGAHEIDLDTEAGWAKFALFEPEPIDFASFVDVLEGANYTLRTIEITAHGTVVERDGHKMFELDRSGQLVALLGDVATARRGRLHGTIVGGSEIEVRSFSDEPAGASAGPRSLPGDELVEVEQNARDGDPLRE